MPSGLKWATCNVGANSPEEYGDYYAWGETETKDEYTEENSYTYGVKMNDISGDPKYDVARKKWGGKWRMPTYDEMEELIVKCSWEWIEQNGTNGYKVTGPNGNHIFIPDASSYSKNEMGYWCSQPQGDYWFNDSAWGIILYEHNCFVFEPRLRCDVKKIRPVIQ